MRRLPALLLVLLFLAGCSTPTSRLRALADSQGFERSSVTIDGFRHTVFANAAAGSDTLHIYLEGDGTPWRHRTIITTDPTPRSPLMLRLMALDTEQSVYVGRPCYNGTANQPGCDNRLWTSDRYSAVVVDSMAGVIRNLARKRGNPRLRLFGHSGGGALALLLAERLGGVSDVLTVAGNLDTDAWTTHHGYTPLYGSLNPATRPPLPDALTQWHLVGERDGVIPPPLVQGFIARQKAAVGVSVGGFTHGCCWAQVWPQILAAVSEEHPESLPGFVFKQPSLLNLEPPDASADAPASP